MKNHLRKFKLRLSASIVVGFAAFICPSHASASDTNAIPVEVARKSVFQDDLATGKDPFFPKSSRRAEKVPVAGESARDPIVLSLKGISGPANRRFALINNQTVAAGESTTVRAGQSLIKIRCWEIRADSVVVTIEGSPERKELRLRENL